MNNRCLSLHPDGSHSSLSQNSNFHGDGWRLVRSIQFRRPKHYIHMVLIDSKRDMAVYGAALSKILSRY